MQLTPAAVAVILMLPAFCNAQLLPGAGGGARSLEPLPSTQPPAKLDIPIPETPAMAQKLAGRVTQFRISGLITVPEPEIAALLAPWIGRELDAAELSTVLNAVRTHLRQRGLFVAEAYFPDQQVAAGVVEIAVLEGKVGAVIIDSDANARLQRSLIEGFLSPLRPGASIERGIFDTALLLLNDLPGVRVSPSLTPGAARGTADVQVRVDDEPAVTGYLRLDNHEIHELGRYQAVGYLRLRNPLGIGDLATAHLYQSVTGDRSRGALTYSAPINTMGTRLGARLSAQDYKLKGDFEALHANGRYVRGGLMLTHPFLRTNDSNVAGMLLLDEVHYKDRMDAVASVSDSRHRYASLQLHADKADNFLRSGNTGFYAEYRTGHVYLDTPAVAAADATGLGVAGRFERGRIRVAREQALTERSSVTASLLSQWSSKNLDFGHALQLGGPEGVRAYGLADAFVDEGHLARIEYHYAMPLGEGWRSRMSLFVDSARGSINKNSLPGAIDNSHRLTGYGVALAVGWREKIVSELTFAWPATAPATDSNRHPRLWAAVSYFF